MDSRNLKRAGMVRNCDGSFYEHGPGAYCLMHCIGQYGFVDVKILGDKSLLLIFDRRVESLNKIFVVRQI